MPGKETPVYQLLVELNDLEPRIWRRLLVRSDLGLDYLHAAIQIAMGWTNSHLHQFTLGETRYSSPALGMNEDRYEGEPLVKNEGHCILWGITAAQERQFLYEYDFGDSWEHVVTIEKADVPAEALDGYALCLDGARACPPDDCGGTSGYEDLLEIIKNPKHEEYKEMKEWLGRPFDPEAFDKAGINKFLKKLKWKHPTIDQLGGILMERDDGK
jgi:hypothetical protein